MSNLATIETGDLAPARQFSDDADLARRWLHSKAPATRRAYEADLRRFANFVGKPVAAVGIGDLQDFADSLVDLAPNTQARVLSAVKSLLTFAHRNGHTARNIGAALPLPKRENRLAERILSEPEVYAIFDHEPDRQRRAMLRLLYLAGLRVSELCELCWRNLQDRGDTGQVTVFGKGGKTRAVILHPAIWAELLALRPDGVDPDQPVFVSRKGGAFTRSSAWRIVRNAAQRAGVRDGKVSPHWMRHAHASHYLDRNGDIHVLRDTLGHADLHTTSRYVHSRPGTSSSLALAG